MIDLHIHSCFSDGKLTPQEIIDRWISKGYTKIAITDHDGIEGSRRGSLYSQNKEIEFIPGIEFDSEDEQIGYDLHILGYGIDYESKALNDALKQVRRWRDERNEKLINAIAELGYAISLQDVNNSTDSEYIGKPTIAKYLIAKGYVRDINEAFKKIIDNTPKADIGRKRALPSKFVIDVIHAAGGKAVLAHPMEQKRRDETWDEYKPRLRKILDIFVSYGIDGIECHHPSASEEQAAYLTEYAESHGLLKTRGSDFHSDEMKRDYSRFHK